MLGIKAQVALLAVGDRVLVRSSSFHIAGGQIGEVWGDNGAGKTSLLRMVANAPSRRNELRQGIVEGAVSTNGRARISASFSSSFHGVSLRAHQVMEPARILHGAKRDRVDECLALFGIDGNARVRLLSKGEMRRLSLAQMMIASRDVLVVDEPYSNLDHKWCAFVDQIFDAHASQGGTVVLALPDQGYRSPDPARASFVLDNATIVRRAETGRSSMSAETCP